MSIAPRFSAVKPDLCRGTISRPSADERTLASLRQDRTFTATLPTHKHTASPPDCAAMAGIASGAQNSNNRAPSRRYLRGEVWPAAPPSRCAYRDDLRAEVSPRILRLAHGSFGFRLVCEQLRA
jgi:hypothetical protein